uniref:Uncharacterized protein n=1 Tax=Anguilla anguilla TaxID=7936 RepID=A0A0E9RBT1_ANGAN
MFLLVWDVSQLHNQTVLVTALSRVGTVVHLDA